MSTRPPQDLSADPSPRPSKREGGAQELAEEDLAKVAGGLSVWFPGLGGDDPHLRSDEELEGFGPPKIE